VYKGNKGGAGAGSGGVAAANNLLKRIRGPAVQTLPQPTIATPSEVQERFQDILSEAVKLATLFTKNEHCTDMLMYGHKLKYISCAHISSGVVSADADREFCKDLLEWFCINLQLVLVCIFMFWSEKRVQTSYFYTFATRNIFGSTKSLYFTAMIFSRIFRTFRRRKLLKLNNHSFARIKKLNQTNFSH